MIQPNSIEIKKTWPWYIFRNYNRSLNTLVLLVLASWKIFHTISWHPSRKRAAHETDIWAGDGHKKTMQDPEPADLAACQQLFFFSSSLSLFNSLACVRSLLGLKVLLPLPFLIHGVDDGLSFGVISTPQILNLSLHLLVQVGHSTSQLLIRKVLQLKTEFLQWILVLSFVRIKNIILWQLTEMYFSWKLLQ